MKLKMVIVAVATLMYSHIGMAVTPNDYTCTAPNVEIKFTRTSPTVESKLSYKNTSTSAAIEKPANQIDIEETTLGELISITTLLIHDYKTVRVSFLVPPINLTGLINEVSFETILVDSTQRSSIGGSGLVAGIVSDNKIVLLDCTATFSVF